MKLKNKRIEICGGIASGKTSLASLLYENNIGIPIYENFHGNPFWEAFYGNPGEYIFETELTFTLQHYHDIKKKQDSNLIICDYSLLLDLAYANIGLNGNKLKIYNDTINEIYIDISKADLYIYLECSADEELNRIRHRNRETEKSIQVDFLAQLNNELVVDVEKFSPTHILKINSEEFDFVNNSEHKKEVVSLIQNELKRLSQ
jgi:deoxyguanosine kinase